MPRELAQFEEARSNRVNRSAISLIPSTCSFKNSPSIKSCNLTKREKNKY